MPKGKRKYKVEAATCKQVVFVEEFINMRRYIGYVVMCSAVLLGIATTTAPFIAKMNSDLSYSEGKTLYFKASTYNEESTNGNYGDENLSFLDQDQIVDQNNDNQLAIYTLADIIKSRLDIWNLSEYEVSVQGYDTIAVSVRTKTDSDIQYTYLQNYLSFSGGDYELDVTDESVVEEARKDTWATMLDNAEDAYIESMELSGYNFPFVLVKIPDAYQSDFTDLLKAASDANASSASESSDSSTTEDACKLVLWANRVDGDLYKDSTSGGGSNINLSKKILAVESVSNDNAVYYYDSDEDKETPYLRLIPASNAITSEGGYDPSHAQEAYDAAVYLKNMFNAEPLSITNGNDEHRFALTFTYSEARKATVENLNYYGAWSVYPALGGTMIATLVTVALTCLVLALFNRIFSLVQISAILGAVYASFITFVSFGAQFNIAACLGLLGVLCIAAFGAIYYGASLKDEIYKGRTLKKANQEAAKKSLWPIIDASIVGVILGVFVYIFGGELASKFGTMLVLGSVFALLANLVLTRIGAWLLANDSSMQTKYIKQLNIDSTKIPDLLKEQKQTYFGPYEKKDFTKGKKYLMGIFGGVLVAGIATMIVFGIQNSGNIYNTSAYTEKSTVLRIDVKSTSNEQITVSSLSGIEDIYEKDGTSDLLHCVEIDGKKLADMISGVNDISLSSTPHSVYDKDTTITTYWYYYSVKLSKYVDSESEHTLSLRKGEDASWEKQEELSLSELNDSLRNYLVEGFSSGIDEDAVLVSFATVSPELGQPYVDKIALAVGVALAVSLLYFALRFRPSRGIAAIFGGALVSYSVLAFFVFTRIAVNPLVSLSVFMAALLTLLLALFALNKEKEIYKESREKEKNTLAFRSDCLNKAISRSASSFFLLLMIASYASIAFFGFGPRSFMMIYLGTIMGLLFLGAYDLGLLAPISIFFAKIFSKIKLKPRKKSPKKGGALKKKSNEPEEAIFIGIND